MYTVTIITTYITIQPGIYTLCATTKDDSPWLAFKKENFDPYRDPPQSTDEIPDEEFQTKKKIEGSEELQARNKTLCIK